MIKPVHWSVKELSEMTKDRIGNKFDSNIAVTGLTGLGKSTFLHKFFHKFNDFDIDEKFTMNRQRMIELIKNNKFSYCWNDELISSGNKRKFYDSEQIELIEILTKYRDNFNIVGGAVPFFFTLDKELIKLFGMHINIIKRGIGVVHLPREGRMYNEDIWDVKINQKLEEKWSKKVLKNPNFRIPYHKYTTFAGYVFFGKMSAKQEEHYLELKANERKNNDPQNKDDEQLDFYDKVIGLIKDGKMDDKGLLQLCLFEGKKLSSVKVGLNRRLKDSGESKTITDFFKELNNNKDTNNLHNNNTINKLLSIGGD